MNASDLGDYGGDIVGASVAEMVIGDDSFDDRDAMGGEVLRGAG